MSDGESVLHIGQGPNLPNSTQEEADTRVAHHVSQAIESVGGTTLILTGDTDVATIMAGQTRDILRLEEVWTSFGRGTRTQLFNLEKIQGNIGADKCHALPLFHCLTGCDTTSGFRGKGKLSFWKTWTKSPEITDVFLNLTFGSPNPLLESDPNFKPMTHPPHKMRSIRPEQKFFQSKRAEV